MREAYFHEDDYCQVEILPVANYEFCREQMGEIAEFSTKHDTGFGWTDMFVRSESPTSLKQIGLTRAALESELCLYLPKFDRVLTGYSTYREECRNAIAFGAGTNFVLFAGFDSEYVSHLWLTIYGLTLTDMKLAHRAFAYLSRSHLLLADWFMLALIVLADTDAVARYLSEFQTESPMNENA